ncbi:hypothetical protein CXB51_003232 [Gossypium anomalum]|uniref:AB hydrolase-1 domain-containing protein n=1 Tax=Gossypium anomalum TaxID=47600 RepID=A0A8J5Z277_9ROSI|nr:hypothetical protein CXB51_003232 [Gossypium anomalum]
MARLIRNKQGIPSTLLTRFLNSPSSLLTLPYYSTSKRSLRTLAYEEEIQANPNKPYTHTAFILHGLLGSARNWRSFSRTLVSSLSDSPSEWRMVLVDLRNHGNSAEMEGLDPPHDLVNAAKDLGNLITSKGWDSPDVVIGHSMGGKVALQFAKSCGNRDYGENVKLPKQLWVLDSVPGEVISDNSDGEVEKVFADIAKFTFNSSITELRGCLCSDGGLCYHMLELGFSKSLSEWIGTNLKKAGGEETWAFNLEGAELSYWSLLEHPPKGLEISIVRAEKSDRWDADVITQLERLASPEGDGSAGKISVHVLPGSGHWVHVDNPKGLLEIMAPKLKSLVRNSFHPPIYQPGYRNSSNLVSFPILKISFFEAVVDPLEYLFDCLSGSYKLYEQV